MQRERLSPSPEAAPHVPFSTVLAGLSYALDLTEGQRPGHAIRSCLIGMRIADTLGLETGTRAALFYALLTKDLGCSSNSARFTALFGHDDHDLKVDLKTIDWTRALESFRFVVQHAEPGQFWLRRVWRVLAILSKGEEGARAVVRTRCERGADIATMLGLPRLTSDAIRALDEHWDGRGQPYGLEGESIPLLARILGLAQTLEVFFTSHGTMAAYDMAVARRGSWFEPQVVDALLATSPDDPFWEALARQDHLDHLLASQPEELCIPASDAQLDTVTEAFARVIDAKSPWTYAHSQGVAAIAGHMGHLLGYDPRALRDLRRAALLHDLGKLGVSNLILDKPGRLTDDEFAVMRTHPRHTEQILQRVSCFAHLAPAAAAHHERLDGRGYHRGLSGRAIPSAARVLCAADICDALLASRPYREGLPVERVLDIMQRESGAALDPVCVEALATVLRDGLHEAGASTPAAHLVDALQEDYAQAA